MTAKPARTPRLTREDRLALQRLREYLAILRESAPENEPKAQPTNRQDACV